MKKLLIFGILLLTVVIILGCTSETKTEYVCSDGTIVSNASFCLIEQEPIIEVVEPCPKFTDMEMESGFIFLEDYLSILNNSKDVDGWKILGGNIYEDIYYSDCSKGDSKGENINYYYCGRNDKYPLLTVKNIVDDKGIIQDVLVRNITLVFNEDGKFIDSICSTSWQGN